MYCGSSLVAQMVKNLPAVWEIQVQSLGQKDPLEEGMAWVFLPGVVCGQGSLAGYIQSTGSQRAGHNWATFTHSKCTMLDRRLYNGKWSCTGFTMCKTRVWDFGGRDCPMLSLPTPCPQVCSLYLFLCSCPANRFISVLSGGREGDGFWVLEDKTEVLLSLTFLIYLHDPNEVNGWMNHLRWP